MTKYLIYAENDRKPLKKFKHQPEAMEFASDIRNLAEHGCMTVVKTGDSGDYVWDPQSGSWVGTEGT